MNCMYRTLLAAVALAVSSVTASADTITVCASGCDYTSINAAIGAASDGDIIQLAAETYFEGEQIDTLGKAITLRGVLGKAGEPASVLDGAGKHRVLICQGGETSATVFQDLVIRNGSASDGGGMMNGQSSSPTLSNCTFTGNLAEDGGGMFIDDGSPALNNCTFTSNSAYNSGGGMYTLFGIPVLVDCVFRDNTANNGGGMFGYSAFDSIHLTRCVFSGNLAIANGGGVDVFGLSGSSFHFDSCVFDGNTAADKGGGVSSDIQLTMNECDFTMNTAFGGGGCWAKESCQFTGCSFVGNESIEFAGGLGLFAIDLPPGVLIDDCVFNSNSSQFGAAVALFGSDSPGSPIDRIFVGSTVTGNRSLYGGAIYLSGVLDVSFRDTRVTENEATLSSGGIVGLGADIHLMDTVVCGNDREQISSLWTDGGGNCISDDCEPCEEPFNPCPTDLDQNGITDGGDLGAFFVFWGDCQVEDCLADFNDDEVVDGIDLGILFSAWGPCQ